ncbi:MAG TPA: 6-carboxytetrahydropterin synthase QueD [Methanothermococcus okinawensis]|uniref:6-carboxytetrahydropterin synthase QueD n=1 Tax=Methanothermococcus okinawensis TaxID=155863 RepID=A0A833E1G7_9EURY|nr:6-carboxytetrahydropterin synthase QueD [Methanococcaceae archaeon]HIP84096.1 6-carboxytetrahydropterin synthase QueD [Methanothermococcus okinawensis]HIP91642.1 6-carboxytetrahydropterin synthase QueD [Methanothermococcus okinawensis]
MILELKGLYLGLRFSSAHIVFGHDSCGVIHGHTYYVDVRLNGEPAGEFNFVIDFKVLKKIVKGICKTLDHRLLLPRDHPYLKYTFEGKYIHLVYSYRGCKKEYKLPVEDVLLLPLKGITAEELSLYIGGVIREELLKLEVESIEWIEVTLYEGLGQGITSRVDLK